MYSNCRLEELLLSPHYRRARWGFEILPDSTEKWLTENLNADLSGSKAMLYPLYRTAVRGQVCKLCWELKCVCRRLGLVHLLTVRNTRTVFLPERAGWPQAEQGLLSPPLSPNWTDGKFLPPVSSQSLSLQERVTSRSTDFSRLSFSKGSKCSLSSMVCSMPWQIQGELNHLSSPSGRCMCEERRHTCM